MKAGSDGGLREGSDKLVVSGSYRRPKSVSAQEVKAREALLFFALRVIKDKGPSKDYFVLRCVGGD